MALEARQDVFDLVGAQPRRQQSLDTMHADNISVVVDPVPAGQPSRVQQVLLFVVAQGTDTHSGLPRQFADLHRGLLPGNDSHIGVRV